MSEARGSAATREIDYQGYLLLDRLLELQAPRSWPEHPDEMHFIITHQAIELWFRLMVRTVRQARDEVAAAEWVAATATARRLTRYTGVVLAQTSTLAEMPPGAFHKFRQFLGTASGLQSSQFRELEILSGHRDESYLDALRRAGGGRLEGRHTKALAEPSLAAALQQGAADAGVRDWARFYAEEAGRSPLYTLCEALVDYDEAWFRWRCEHRILVERMLGGGTGTAGTRPSYLEKSLQIRFFPWLWQARGALALLSPDA
ncbi:tryptophan 2,3-dioxygenase family protein [Actinoplanes sp. Pm04-4]|uniref:Tryptophan 2,3-dioxygenase family protein n=1 Tax=Paractinoplanes pyxinae TaxID=2997416 RepID=A0ABT4BAS7_9ACTN|nr:tryptophan 2,3-dioxygenase family protein [Actinoplanes pyxinae]MCY1143633.1 tryptophan 2,3-dioxygenase family protein [Actinoplanes pyxinae]